MRTFIVVFLFLTLSARAQDPSRFQEEVIAIQKKYDTLWDASKETIVFTGSSSIRLWLGLQGIFPEYHIINSGFGGSQASDLLAYTEDLVLKFNPIQVFIYEGDNDIFFAKKPEEILSDTKKIIAKIKKSHPGTEIVLIAAKPSLARWHLKSKYKRLNRKFRRLCKNDPSLKFADVWNTMLERKKVRGNLFIEDGLHMNAKGYALWLPVIRTFIN